MAGELALSAVLLVGAGLLLCSLAELHATDPGFDPDGVLAFSLSLRGQRYADASERLRTLVVTFAAVTGLLAITALVASWLPARRAASGPVGFPARLTGRSVRDRRNR